MELVIALFCVFGLAIDIWFIKTELEEKMARATLLKGMASLVFVILGVYCYISNATEFGILLLIGLALGMAGDIFLNLRNQFEGGKAMKVFAVGVLAFLSGHFFYIAALIGRAPDIVLIALIAAAVISVISIPLLMRQVTAPSKGMKIFGYVYLVIVIAMFCCAATLLLKQGASSLSTVFSIGAFLFMVSDFIMIYYSFGKKLKPLRVSNLLSYYVGQLMIAICILLA